MHFSMAGVDASPIALILWGMFVGYVFTTVGAAGGILAGVGHMSIFGIKNANMVKPMNQVLTLVSPVVGTPLYLREKRIVVPTAIALGLGGIIGALIGSSLSHTYLKDMATFKPYFGFFTLLIAVRLFYECSRKFIDGQKSVKQANQAFAKKVKELKENGKLNELKEIGVNFNQVGLQNSFTFAGQEFKYNALTPFIAGIIVAIISASLGVGGGFLLVPFMTSIMGFPMYIVAGTSVLSILVSSLTSIGNYLKMGSQIDFSFLGFELIGVAIGTIIAAHLSKFINARKLKYFLAFVLFYIGIKYMFGPMIQAATGISI
ncbi:sulfite exporter TauE/SafE family protein [Desulforamulus aquiferis]|uniref:Probable membrane transporter protein n=1 Tax=Desulforamulus aquiferis TaxID=1397668 RepID=A0AAW7ZH47_9FIRM|nr:sulfite exporter TauE/SafE family protein [Desulforamulus aquiferis]MDO7788780.1 sulfite exporter TauE/SafE family protein [Desulforamulus aquiferis]